MKINLTHQQIQAGAPYKIKPEIIWDGATITKVTAMIADQVDANLPVKLIIGPVELTGDPLAVILSESQTVQLLADPANLLSPLKYTEVFLVLKVEGTDADGDLMTPALYSQKIKIGRVLV